MVQAKSFCQLVSIAFRRGVCTRVTMVELLILKYMFAERHKNCKISLCNFLIMFVLLPFYNCATNANKENCNRHSLVASVPEALVCWRRFALYQSYYGYRLTSSHILFVFYKSYWEKLKKRGGTVLTRHASLFVLRLFYYLH